VNFFFYDFDFVPFFKEYVTDIYERQKIPLGPTHFFAKSYPELHTKANHELQKKKLPRLQHIHFFNWPANYVDATAIHVDGAYGSYGLKNTAYNIPIFGSENVVYEWFAKPYVLKEIVATMPNGNIRKVIKPVFQGQPVVSDNVLVTNSMFLCTSKPHRVSLSKEKRLVVSLRFESNWDVSQFKIALHNKDAHG